jgi:hypothetical protein
MSYIPEEDIIMGKKWENWGKLIKGQIWNVQKR